MERRQVILADDHQLLRQGLRMILNERDDLEVIEEVSDGLELIKTLNRKKPDIIILDISMPHLRGIETIPEIKRLRPEVRILVLTMHRDEEFLRQAIAAGADGYLLKEDAEKDLFFAIDAILQGRIYVSRFLAEESRHDWAQIRRGKRVLSDNEPLTVREREVLKLIAEGKSSKEIGELLCISVRTVERHRANVMGKLNVNRTVDLVKYAFRKGYV
jgi:DNA-binding NarL/FixJ family response regulator